MQQVHQYLLLKLDSDTFSCFIDLFFFDFQNLFQTKNLHIFCTQNNASGKILFYQ